MLCLLYMCYFLFYLQKISANEADTSQKDEDTSLLYSFRNMCPYNQFCQSSPLKQIPSKDDNEPCCEKCSCDKDCFKTGSCCPDISLSEPAAIEYPCKHLAHFGKSSSNLISDNDISYWHHVINNCPDLKSATSHPKCYKPINVEDYEIVSDEKTGKLYRNKHCAECNGIKKYSMLKLKAECSGLLTNFTNAAERDNYLLEKCSLISFPPEKLNGISNCIPETLVISACNVTGNWDVYDKDVELACLNKKPHWNTVFRNSSVYTSRNKYFSNVYCFLCNKANITNKEDSCGKETSATKSKSLYVSFFAVIDTKTIEKATTKIDTVCESSHILDPFKNICRQVVCPAGSIPFHGSCKGLIDLYGYVIDLHFNVIFKDGNIPSNALITHVLERRLSLLIGNDIECGKCAAALYYLNDLQSTMIFSYAISTNGNCLYDVMMQRLQQIAMKTEINVSFTYINQQFHVSLIFNFGNLIRNKTISFEHTSVRTFCGGYNYLDQSILQYCPSIMLTEDEVSELKLYNESKVSVSRFQQANDFQSAIYQVCLRTYFAAKQALTSASADADMPFDNVNKLIAIITVSLSLKHTLFL